MATRDLVRGDDYTITRPLFKFQLLDSLLQPLDIRGCKLQVTWKPVLTSIEADPNDTSAIIKHELQINLAGTVTLSNGLVLDTTALTGVVYERLTKTESANMPLNTELVGDLQLTNSAGEVLTWIFTDKIRGIDGVTHRNPT